MFIDLGCAGHAYTSTAPIQPSPAPSTSTATAGAAAAATSAPAPAHPTAPAATTRNSKHRSALAAHRPVVVDAVNASTSTGTYTTGSGVTAAASVTADTSRHVLICSLGEVSLATVTQLVAVMRPEYDDPGSIDSSTGSDALSAASTHPPPSTAGHGSADPGRVFPGVVILQQSMPDRRFLARVAAMKDVWFVQVSWLW